MAPCDLLECNDETEGGVMVGMLPPCRMCRLQLRLMQMAADYCAYLQAGNEKDMICLLKPVMRKRTLAATLEQVCGRPRYTATAGETGRKRGGGALWCAGGGRQPASEPLQQGAGCLGCFRRQWCV